MSESDGWWLGGALARADYTINNMQTPSSILCNNPLLEIGKKTTAWMEGRKDGRMERWM